MNPCNANVSNFNYSLSLNQEETSEYASPSTIFSNLNIYIQLNTSKNLEELDQYLQNHPNFNINHKNSEGNSLLYQTIFHENFGAFKLLVEKFNANTADIKNNQQSVIDVIFEFDQGKEAIEQILNYVLTYSTVDFPKNFHQNIYSSNYSPNTVAIFIPSKSDSSNYLGNLIESDAVRLYHAIDKQNPEEIEDTLSQINHGELDFTEIDNQGEFVLMQALKKCPPRYYQDIAAKLDLTGQEDEAETGCNVFMLAITEGAPTDFIKTLLDKCPNQEDLLAWRCKYNRNALVYAAMHNRVDVFQFILTTLKDLKSSNSELIDSLLTIVDEENYTILELALIHHPTLFNENADLTIIDTLLALKSMTNSPVFKRHNLLLYVLQNKFFTKQENLINKVSDAIAEELINLSPEEIIALRADLHIKDSLTLPSIPVKLHRAVQKKINALDMQNSLNPPTISSRLCSTILKRIVDSGTFMTAQVILDLNLFIPKISSSVLKKFINLGANVNARDILELTPIMHAVLNDAPNGILEYLIKQGANLELKDNKYQQTIVQIATFYYPRVRNTVRCLIKNGANASVLLNGKNLATLAIERGVRSPLINYLVNTCKIFPFPEYGSDSITQVASCGASDNIIDILIAAQHGTIDKELMYAIAEQARIEQVRSNRQPETQKNLYRKALSSLLGSTSQLEETEDNNNNNNNPIPTITVIHPSVGRLQEPLHALHKSIERTLAQASITVGEASQFSFIGGEAICGCATAEAIKVLLEGKQLDINSILKQAYTTYHAIIYNLRKTNFLNSVQKYQSGTHLTWLQDVQFAYPCLVHRETKSEILIRTGLNIQVKNIFSQLTKENNGVGISLFANHYFFTVVFTKQNDQTKIHFFDSHGIPYFDNKAYALTFDDLDKASDFVSLRLSMLMYPNQMGMETKFDITTLDPTHFNTSPLVLSPPEEWARLFLTYFSCYEGTAEKQKSLFIEKILPSFKIQAASYYEQLSHPLFLLLHYFKTQKELDLKADAKLIKDFFIIYPHLSAQFENLGWNLAIIENFDVDHQKTLVLQLEILLEAVTDDTVSELAENELQGKCLSDFLFSLSGEKRENFIKKYISLYLSKELNQAKVDCITQEMERLQKRIEEDKVLYLNREEKNFLRMERFDEILALCELIHEVKNSEVKASQDLNHPIEVVINMILDIASLTKEFLIKFDTFNFLQKDDLKIALGKMHTLFTILYNNKQLCSTLNQQATDTLIKDYKAIVSQINKVNFTNELAYAASLSDLDNEQSF